MDEALAARLKPSSIAKAETLHQAEIEALQGQVATLQAQTAVDLFSNSGAGWDTAPMVKRRDLIQHFGGLQEVMRASAKDLATVPGIGLTLAETIYDALHSH